MKIREEEENGVKEGGVVGCKVGVVEGQKK